MQTANDNNRVIHYVATPGGAMPVYAAMAASMEEINASLQRSTETMKRSNDRMETIINILGLK